MTMWFCFGRTTDDHGWLDALEDQKSPSVWIRLGCLRRNRLRSCSWGVENHQRRNGMCRVVWCTDQQIELLLARRMQEIAGGNGSIHQNHENQHDGWNNSWNAMLSKVGYLNLLVTFLWLSQRCGQLVPAKLLKLLSNGNIVVQNICIILFAVCFCADESGLKLFLHCLISRICFWKCIENIWKLFHKWKTVCQTKCLWRGQTEKHCQNMTIIVILRFNIYVGKHKQMFPLCLESSFCLTMFGKRLKTFSAETGETSLPNKCLWRSQNVKHLKTNNSQISLSFQLENSESCFPV